MKKCDELLKSYNYSLGNEQKDPISKLKKDSSQVEVKFLIYEIVLWKLNRMVYLDEDSIKRLLNIKELLDISKISLEKFLKSDELKNELCETMKKLMNCGGIRIAMASTILHFFCPEFCPIIDKRAYFALYKEKMPERFNKPAEGPNAYLKYIEKCYNWFKQKEEKGETIEFKNIDKILYQHDKESNRKVDELVKVPSPSYADIWEGLKENNSYINRK